MTKFGLLGSEAGQKEQIMWSFCPLVFFIKTIHPKEGRLLSIKPKDRVTGCLKDKFGKRGRSFHVKKGARWRAKWHQLQVLFQNRCSLLRTKFLRLKRLTLTPTPDPYTSSCTHIAHP